MSQLIQFHPTGLSRLGVSQWVAQFEPSGVAVVECLHDFCWRVKRGDVFLHGVEPTLGGAMCAASVAAQNAGLLS